MIINFTLSPFTASGVLGHLVFICDKVMQIVGCQVSYVNNSHDFNPVGSGISLSAVSSPVIC